MWWGCEVDASALIMLDASIPCLRGSRFAMINMILRGVTANSNEYGGGGNHNSTRDSAVAITDRDDKTTTLVIMTMTILR